MTEPYPIGTRLRYIGPDQTAFGLEMIVEEVMEGLGFHYRGSVILAGRNSDMWPDGSNVTLIEDYELVSQENYGVEDD